MKLDNGYEIRELAENEFITFQKPLRGVVFAEDHSIFPSNFTSSQEKKMIDDLGSELYKNQFKLHVGVFSPNGEFVGWHFGFQESAHIFYMCNSAILEEHRNKGLYSALLKYTIDLLKEKGFQIIYSRHNATNNSVIVPKLKAGFLISSLEMCDVFGVLVHLKFYTNNKRKKLMDYRSGQLRPDDDLIKLF